MKEKETPVKQTKEELVFSQESAHLEEIRQMIALELIEAERSVEQMDEEYREAQLYMAEHHGEGDAKEMFQSEMALKQIDSWGSSAVAFRDKLKKAQGSPYFARIDFCPQGERKASPYYIGLYAVHHKKQLMIIDWRAPLASMFYDFELGHAFYDAPKARIEGELVLKRQFKITDGKLEYAFDSSQNIQDDILQKELAHTSDEKMKSIISTIQKEQNQIIRNEKAHTMIIQGVAGSGKTSIALHRVAFLLYRFRNTIKAQNVTIISPNKVFGDYISGVLPELGEEPIFEASLEDLALVQLEEGVDFIGERDTLETPDKAYEERARYKATGEFAQRLMEFAGEIAQVAFEAQDFLFEPFCVPADWIQSRVEIYQNRPLLKRLEEVADDIHSRLENEFLREEKPPHRNRILQSLKKMLRFKTTLSLYREFYRREGKKNFYVPVQKGVLEWEDVYPYLYLQSAFSGLQESRLIKHLVIDEMQDYTPIQYAVLNRLFQCPKTILGDFGQSINPNSLTTLEELSSIYPEAQLVRLEKSYRSTYEIIHFAKGIVSQQDFQAVERHGEKPELFSFGEEEEEISFLAEKIEAFDRGEYNALGIVTKTNRQAKELFEKLKDQCPKLHLILPESQSFQSGAVILSIQMAKGLEFDEVVVPFAEKGNYFTGFDRNLLYVACTRAMHKLSLSCTGEPSPLLP